MFFSKDISNIINTIDVKSFDPEVKKEKKPVLVVVFRKNNICTEEIKILEEIQEKYIDDLKIYLLDDNYNKAFMKDHFINGTPTYLLFHNGVEKARLLGKHDRDELTSFIDLNINIEN